MTELTAFKTELVSVAKSEHDRLGSLRRGDAALNERIRLYCRDLHVSFAEPIECFHYSAVFISWCMRQAGATEDEFPAAVGHWEYAQRAIQDAEHRRGLFRARRIERYAPQPGDLVHVNRDGGKVDYEQARDVRYSYRSESGIVTDGLLEAGQAMIVMGNQHPHGTVGTESLQLTKGGLLIQRAENPFICIIEVLK